MKIFVTPIEITLCLCIIVIVCAIISKICRDFGYYKGFTDCMNIKNRIQNDGDDRRITDSKQTDA